MITPVGISLLKYNTLLLLTCMESCYQPNISSRQVMYLRRFYFLRGDSNNKHLDKKKILST